MFRKTLMTLFFHCWHFSLPPSYFYRPFQCFNHDRNSWKISNMSTQSQFGFKKSLDRIIQLIYLSSNVFTDLEVQNQVCALNVKDSYSETEKNQLLTYFLDLIESLSLERIYLTQDPNDAKSYFNHGGF